jgi:predicted RNase H-like nuclease
MTLVCGVDGCSSGWVSVSKELPTGQVSWSYHPDFTNLMTEKRAAQIIAVHIPIGLPERGTRLCDSEARRILGTGCGGRVFPAPIRPVLAAANATDASQIRYEVEGKKVSPPAYRVVSRVREFDTIVRHSPQLRQKVFEVHPEVSFFFLAGARPMRYSKKTGVGRAERQEVLERVFAHSVADALEQRLAVHSSPDDVLDAFAALWTAERIYTGAQLTIPPVPPLDVFGLQMEIVA